MTYTQAAAAVTIVSILQRAIGLLISFKRN